MMRAVQLEEAGRDPDLQLLRQLLHRERPTDARRSARVGEQALVLDAAEIGAFEQLGRKHDLGALRTPPRARDRATARMLATVSSVKASCSAATVSLVMREPAGEMQWKLPPPVRMWSARRPIATRSGKSAWTTSTAALSLGAPYCGTTTAALPM